MASIKCFEPGCEDEVECACNCTSPPTYSCENHFMKHRKSSKKVHTVEFVYSQPIDETKEAMLKLLAKEKSKQDKLKQKFLASFSQNLLNSKSSLESHLQKLDSHSEEISTSLEKVANVQRIEKTEEDPFIALLTLQPEEAIEKAKSMISDKSASYSNAKLFCSFNEEIEKMIEIFIKDKFETLLDKKLENIEKTLIEHDKMLKEEKKVDIDVDKLFENKLSEIEKSRKEFEDWKNEIELKRTNDINFLNFQLQTITEDLDKKISSLSENQLKNENFLSEIQIEKLKEINYSLPESELKANLDTQIYEECNENALIYSLGKANENYVHLSTYNIESGKKEIKKIAINPLEYSNISVVQLPNNELQCSFLVKDFKSYSMGVAFEFYFRMFIIRRDKRVQYFPNIEPKSPIRKLSMSGIYFSGSVYYFGLFYPSYSGMRFDLGRNEWVHLINKWPQLNSRSVEFIPYNCIAFNGNILIASNLPNLIQYSIANNSYATIPFQFTDKSIKVLLNAERLYLIEVNGCVYESEIGQEHAWKKISGSIIANAPQINVSYYKGEAYISCGDDNYYKFNFNSKEITKL